jgi:hypothetical protein
MKITEEAPKLLQIMYDNCDENLRLFIEVKSDCFIVKGRVIKFQQQPDKTFSFASDTFNKCYVYLLSIEYITEKWTDDVTKKDVQIAHKGIDFIENSISHQMECT